MVVFLGEPVNRDFMSGVCSSRSKSRPRRTTLSEPEMLA